jgi:HD-GYP domain-containing protein (c-di-GMP phosphodiesterase class II)
MDVMISERPYSPAMRVEEALAELRRCAGTQFEQVLADRAAGVQRGVTRVMALS